MSVDHTHPYQVHFEKNRYHQIQEMVVWCHGNVGDGGYIGRKNDAWILITAFGKSSWLFKNQKDATMFALRWR